MVAQCKTFRGVGCGEVGHSLYGGVWSENGHGEFRISGEVRDRVW